MPLKAAESDLRALARHHIARGTLHARPLIRVWGGQGDGRPCSLCQERIVAPDFEYDVLVGEQALHFHMVCHSVWQLECASAFELRSDVQPVSNLARE